jgi:hypothetical protein
VITFKRITGFLVLVACLVAAGCGSDDEGAGIPADSAQQLQDRLDEIQRRFEFGGGACADIQNDSLPAVEDLINSLPEDVDADVRQALTDGFQRLFVLTDEQCEEPQTETEPEPEPEPVPVPTDTTETTAPPETTETIPPPTETEAPPATDTEPAPLPGEGGDADGAEGGSGGSGQGGDGTGVQGGTGGGALVPEGQG